MNIDVIREQLTKEKQELTTRLEKIQADMETGRSRDWNEQAQERENDDVLDSLSVEAKAQLTQINNALEKIENNQYGYCEKCDQAISEERLQAIPAAITCINCAS